MKLLAVLFVLFAVHEITAEVTAPCDKEETKCHMTETKAYMKCLEKKRTKRNVLCPYSPTVVQPYNTAVVQPYASSFVQPYAVQCNTPNCGNNVVLDNCVNSCSGSCNGFNCQDRCEKSCTNDQVITVQSTPTRLQNEQGIAPSVMSPNVTTTIHLTNIINNTNHINVPTSINNTNINNLDLGTNSSSYQAMAAANSRKCCIVVEPKVCNTLNSTTGAKRCVHRRHHTCGPKCESSTMHAQLRQPCKGTPEECPPSIAYVPQPRPKCSYTQRWPYVTCGTNNMQGATNCEGCYDHYGYGYQNFHAGSDPGCQGCYDDGFDQGSMYRQGPYYRPGYYHTPPVDMPAYTSPVSCGGGGCFGNQMIDPAFGMASCSPYAGGCAPSSQYYGMAENYDPTQQYYPPMQPFYPPPQQYYPPMPQYYAPPQPYYAPPQQYYPPIPQFYQPPQPSYPGYPSFYDPNMQFYGEQNYSPDQFNINSMFNTTLFNETLPLDVGTGIVGLNGAQGLDANNPPLRPSPFMRQSMPPGYFSEYSPYPYNSPFANPFLRGLNPQVNAATIEGVSNLPAKQ